MNSLPPVTALLLSVLLCTCDPAQEEVPQEGPVRLSRDSISLTVDPTYGGRLISLTYGGKELLNTERDSSGFTYGSTAWPSPQDDWKWPPPAAIDSEPYTVQKIDSHSVLLISRPTEAGLVMQKRFRLGPESDIGLTYWLTNKGDSTRSVAAWEVTRLPYGGRVDFVADSLRTTDATTDIVESQDSLRTIFFDDRHAQSAKVFANLLRIPVSYYRDGIVLHKETIVTDFYRVAPEQAPLEIFFDPERKFMELELQGDYRELGYGETATLRTRWVVGNY